MVESNLQRSEPHLNEIDRWLDLMALVNVNYSKTGIDTQTMLEIIQKIWGDSVDPEEYEMLGSIFSHTESYINGEIAESEWVDRMNSCFMGMWS